MNNVLDVEWAPAIECDTYEELITRSFNDGKVRAGIVKEEARSWIWVPAERQWMTVSTLSVRCPHCSKMTYE